MHITQVKIIESGLNEAAETCVAKAVATWRFQPAKDDLVVQKAFDFEVDE